VVFFSSQRVIGCTVRYQGSPKCTHKNAGAEDKESGKERSPSPLINSSVKEKEDCHIANLRFNNTRWSRGREKKPDVRGGGMILNYQTGKKQSSAAHNVQ